jgi:hypothetical protein
MALKPLVAGSRGGCVKCEDQESTSILVQTMQRINLNPEKLLQ